MDASQGGMLTKAQVEEDRTQVIENLEEVHPFFLLEENSEEYKTAKENYQDGKTYLCENGENTAVWIEEIGGIPIEEIYQKIDLIRAEENVNAGIENRDWLVLYKNVLKSCGVKVRQEKTEVLFSDGRKETFQSNRLGAVGLR